MTPQQLEAIEDVITIAYEDQRYYLTDIDPAKDYGDEWPEVARSKAESFRKTAEFLTSVNGSAMLISRLNRLASDLEASAHEFRNAEVGN